MEIQQKQVLLLQMIKKVDELFRQNNIPYTLLGGSVLGAIRHKGFIPWDDDIDIGIFRNDFEKAEKLLLTLKQLIYEPIDGNTLPTVHIGKLRFPEDNKKGDNLSSIDVFPLDYYPEDKKAQHNININKKWWILAVLKRPARNHGKFMTFITWVLINFIPRIIWNKIKKHSYVQITKCNNKSSNLVANIFGSWGEKEVFPRSIYENTIYVQFEDTKLPIPADYEQYLTQMYGNYMTPPPIEYRIPNHTSKRLY